MKRKKHLQNISIEMTKELFTEMFKAQEETIRKIVSSCNSDTIVRFDGLSGEIQDNNERLQSLNKETVDLKINLETSQEIFEKKFQKVDDKQKQKLTKTLTNFGKTTTSSVRDLEISKTDLVVII